MTIATDNQKKPANSLKPKVFWLPTHVVEHYDLPDDPDDPSFGYDPDQPSGGDEGWSWNALRASIKEHGIQKPIEVGMSAPDLHRRGDNRPYAFNGNHRLWVAREQHHPYIPCIHSNAEDAMPLDDEQIRDLGGQYERET